MEKQVSELTNLVNSLLSPTTAPETFITAIRERIFQVSNKDFNDSDASVILTKDPIGTVVMNTPASFLKIAPGKNIPYYPDN